MPAMSHNSMGPEDAGEYMCMCHIVHKQQGAAQGQHTVLSSILKPQVCAELTDAGSARAVPGRGGSAACPYRGAH